MASSSLVASGNLATPRRTVTGVLGQLQMLRVGETEALAMFTDAGLPARALQEPDFPISLQQELSIALLLVQGLEHSPARTLFEAAPAMGIEQLGVLGMAMRHAADGLEALKICLTYPQLTWGHCRMLVYREGDATRFVFAMERPQLRDAAEDVALGSLRARARSPALNWKP